MSHTTGERSLKSGLLLGAAVGFMLALPAATQWRQARMGAAGTVAEGLVM